MVESTRKGICQALLVVAVLCTFAFTGCQTVDSLANRMFIDDDLSNIPEATFDPETGEFTGGVI